MGSIFLVESKFIKSNHVSMTQFFNNKREIF